MAERFGQFVGLERIDDPAPKWRASLFLERAGRLFTLAAFPDASEAQQWANAAAERRGVPFVDLTRHGEECE